MENNLFTLYRSTNQKKAQQAKALNDSQVNSRLDSTLNNSLIGG